MEDISIKDYGKKVKVVRGRKVPIDTIGIIVWFDYYERGYVNSGIDPYQCIQKLGIKDNDGKMHYTYTKNVEWVD
jgi:hypothetical protein